MFSLSIPQQLNLKRNLYVWNRHNRSMHGQVYAQLHRDVYEYKIVRIVWFFFISVCLAFSIGCLGSMFLLGFYVYSTRFQ